MAMKFLNRWVLEPMNDYIYGARKVSEKMGVLQPIDQMFYSLNAFGFDILFKQSYDFQAINGEMVPKTGAAVIVVNHQSWLDPAIIGVALIKSTNRQAWQLAKADLISNNILNNYTRMGHSIYVRRGESDQVALAQCRDKLNSGDLVVVYPEGTLGPGNGKFLEFKTGALRLAYDCEVPIIPAAIYGSDIIFGKGAKFPKSKGMIRITFGKALTAEKLVKMKEISSGVSIPDFEKGTVKLQRIIHELWAELWAEAQTPPTESPTLVGK
jgi:1-acyl-sn-glycerol-3-phosphate acyltransferase